MIIDKFKEQGMEINNKNDINNYLSYNTCWSILKPSRNLLHIKIENQNKKYENVKFNDIIIARTIHIHFNKFVGQLITKYENYLKCYISNNYCDVLDIKKNKQIIPTKLKNTFLSDAIKFIRKQDIKLKNMYFNKEINHLRNCIAHQSYILIENKDNNYNNISEKLNDISLIYNENQQVLKNCSEQLKNCSKSSKRYIKALEKSKKIIINELEKSKKITFRIFISEDEQKYLKQNSPKNNLKTILELMESVHSFAMLSPINYKKYSILLKDLNKELKCVKENYKLIKQKSWVNHYMSLISKQLYFMEEDYENHYKKDYVLY